MKAIPAFLAGAGFGAVVTYLIMSSDNYGDSLGNRNPDTDDLADKASAWGAKQRLSGAGTGLVGKVKQGFGEITGDHETANKGVGDQIVGDVKSVAGKAADAVGDTIRDLNR